MHTVSPSAEELFHSHVRLVYSALRYCRAWMERHRDDLTQVAMLALWEAVNSEFSGDFVAHCRRCIGRSIAQFIRTEKKQSRKVIGRYVSRETGTNHMECAPDLKTLKPLEFLIQQDIKREIDSDHERLTIAMNRLPDYRRDLVSRYASGKVKTFEKAQRGGDSVTAKILDLLQFLRDETATPGSGDLAGVLTPIGAPRKRA